MIRKAKPTDLEAIVALGVEALETDPIEGLLISQEKIRAMAREVISNPSDFIWVAEDEAGNVVGSVAAQVYPMMFYERSQANVVQFYCKQPGEGVKLIREFMRWAMARPIIKMVIFTVELGADPRIGRMLERMGLHQDGPVYVRYK